MTAGPLEATAAAKINLALLVGPVGSNGLHEVATVMQRIDICDRLTLEPAERLVVTGFDADTLVTSALERMAEAVGIPPRWSVELEKHIPVAAGLGGGSADAAAALVLANRALGAPLSTARLLELAAALGSDVPFFVGSGPKLVEGTGERLTPLPLPQDFWVLVALPAGITKRSTGAVYRRFDELGGGAGFSDRRTRLLERAASCVRAEQLASLPANDLGPAAGDNGLPGLLVQAGAFRADVSGAGPAVYGLFRERQAAVDATPTLPRGTRTWVAAPVW